MNLNDVLICKKLFPENIYIALNTPTAPLQKGKTPSKECPVYDTKQSDGEVPVKLKLWGMPSFPSLPLLPDPLWPGVVAPDWDLSMGLIELNCILMLNWIVWIRTVWPNLIAWNRNVFDNYTVNLHLNCILMVKWIVWNGTVFDTETVLMLNWIV